MSPRPVLDALVRDSPILLASDTVGRAASVLINAALPALPVVGDDARLAGIFGEQEFLGAVFPGYLKDLHHTGFVKRSLDHVLEKQSAARTEPVRTHMNTEHVDVGTDYSHVQLAEIFLHHCVPLVPVTDDGTVVGVITRADFFRSVVERLVARAQVVCPIGFSRERDVLSIECATGEFMLRARVADALAAVLGARWQLHAARRLMPARKLWGMCVQCMLGVSTAAAGVTGMRAWLAATGFSWMTPRRLRLFTVSLIAAGLIGASVGISGP